MEFDLKKFCIVGLIVLVLGSTVVASSLSDRLNTQHQATVQKVVTNNMNIATHANTAYTGKLNASNAKSYSITEKPKHGIVKLENSGSFTYTPNKNFVGPDSFKYKAINGKDSKIATVTIKVTNNPPVANDISFKVQWNAPHLYYGGHGFFNATDSDGDKLSYRVIDKLPADGCRIDIYNIDGSFLTTSNYPSLVFHYVANDGVSDSNIATATSTL